MKNKELLNICYKFLNRFITTDILIEELENIDKTKLSKKDIEKTMELIDEIKRISHNTPNEIDEYALKEKQTISNLIKIIESIPKNSDNAVFLNQQLDSLKKDYNKNLDSQERWIQVTDCINKNEYFNHTFESLSDYELLEFIVQNIKAPFPPNLTQEDFDRLVKIGIEKDKREWLFRLAFNYEGRKMNFDSIVDYFIDKKDGYYLIELIIAVGEYLNVERMIDKINDKEFIEDLITRKEEITSCISKEQWDKLMNKFV